MAKLKSEAIEDTDLLEFLKSYSDFSFELGVLKMLRGHGLDCEHGGHYEDPVTGKSREFDIRTTKTVAPYRVRMSVECKNIGANFPVLISCVPRHDQESYHQIAAVAEPETSSDPLHPIVFRSRATTLSITGAHSVYKPGQPVGKSTSQVGRGQDGGITSNDSEIYEKWGQCLSSATDLVSRAYWDGEDDGQSYLSAVIPFVVVPNGRLWAVMYDETGARISKPSPVDRCSCYVNKDYEMGTKMAGARLWLSHVEVVTAAGLEAFVVSMLADTVTMQQLFPTDGIREAYQRKMSD